MLVEMLAIAGKRLVILAIRHGDASVHVENALRGERPLQGVVQGTADPLARMTLRHVNRGLDRPIVGGTALEGPCVGIPHQAPVELGNQIGVELHGFTHALGKLRGRGRDVLEGDRRLTYVGFVYGSQLLGILDTCQPNPHVSAHGHPLSNRFRLSYPRRRPATARHTRPARRAHTEGPAWKPRRPFRWE